MSEEIKKTGKYTATVGRRREASARVRIYTPNGSSKVNIFGGEFSRGDTLVNGKVIGEYFRFKPYQNIYKKFFDITGVSGKYLISVKVIGGGPSGQLNAVLHGIARALVRIDSEKYKKLLRDQGYLTRDARTRERRKVGMGGKARRRKQSPKR